MSGYGSRLRPAYGIVRPFVTFGFLVAGVALGTLAVGLAQTWPLIPAAVAVALGTALLASSGIGLPLLVDRLAREVELEGDERCLDVGCGRGRFQVGLARRLDSGTVLGIDRWRGQDLSGNSREAAHRNLTAEQVAERCELADGDVRALPVADESIDVAVSALVTGFLDADGASRMATEMARVLAPGGVLVSIEPRRSFVAALESAGLTIESERTWSVFPPARVVVARNL